ncbi:MAG TPA: DMT family transporter [Dongiaceae bacterium]|nr:DMT family transporter [Dongiaceae bacterium]
MAFRFGGKKRIDRNRATAQVATMSGAVNRAMGAREWLLLIVLSLLWGGSFFFAELALGELPPLMVVLGRVGFAALALNLVLLVTGRALPRDPRTWGAFFGMGLLNNLIPFSLIFWGQTEIASGLAAILNATTPLFGVVLAHVLTRDERMTAGRLGGVLLGLAGVAVMIGPDALKGLGLDVLAEIAVLGAALSYACAGIFGRRFRGLPPLVTATGQVTATTLMMLPVALALDRPWLLPLPGAVTWTALLGLALVCTALAYVLYFRILATAGATNLLLVTFLIPVSALFLGMTILGERLDPRDFAGMALIGLGLAAIDGRPLARVRALRTRQPAASSRGSG